MKHRATLNLDSGFIEIYSKPGFLIYEAENIVEVNVILKELEESNE